MFHEQLQFCDFVVSAGAMQLQGRSNIGVRNRDKSDFDHHFAFSNIFLRGFFFFDTNIFKRKMVVR